MPGAPVLGGIDQVSRILAKQRIAQVVISTSSIGADRREEIGRVCDEAGVEVWRASLQLEIEPRP